MMIQMEDVKVRLKMLGCKAENADNLAFSFCIDKVANQIKNNCNVSEIPEGLRELAVDRVCGEFLLAKKSAQSIGELIDNAEQMVKSIQDGDTTVVFSESESLEAVFSRLVAFLFHENDYKGELARYRSISW